MHLCSKIDVLTDSNKAILDEGIAYYRALSKVKNRAIPVMPRGFVRCDENIVFTGFKTKEKLYLSVYNMSNEKVTVEQDLTKYGVIDVKMAYPQKAENLIELKDGIFRCEMQSMTARAFEFELKEKD